MNDFIVVLMTAPDMNVAKSIAKVLVTDKLCACVNLIPGALSIYEWDNKLNETPEVLMFAKSIESNYSKLEQKVKTIHPYEVVEIIKLKMDGGDVEYLDWINKVLR
ncbi:MAG: divalent-cation tolerance protein CutA [Proteobacteria bacterium]|jgi:periplasmic divalent cation tolerance protein|nr:divalent-cation tolerance protein CutA [Pseudomonadota bacterium]